MINIPLALLLAKFIDHAENDDVIDIEGGKYTIFWQKAGGRTGPAGIRVMKTGVGYIPFEARIIRRPPGEVITLGAVGLMRSIRYHHMGEYYLPLPNILGLLIRGLDDIYIEITPAAN